LWPKKSGSYGVPQTVFSGVLLMAATAYNLKKLMKFAKTPPKSAAKSMKVGKSLTLLKTALFKLILATYTAPKFSL